MEVWHTRLESFNKAKRVKAPKARTYKWPHPSTYVANPESLAEAGFFFDPSQTNPDGVTCFVCKKSVSDWEEHDDPFAEHLARGQSCYWAIARCGLRDDQDEDGHFIFPDRTRLPTSKTMEKARLDSFGLNWPHDTVRGHGANSKKMAKAGFVFTPQGPDDDTATCFYCTTSLSGWDKDDDPLQEHRKREAKYGKPCPFFASQDATLGKSTSRPPASKASSKPPSRATTSKKTPAPEIEEISSDEEDEPATAARSKASQVKPGTSTRASSVPAKTPGSRKSARSTATSTRSRTTAGSEDEAEASGSDAGKRVSRNKRKAAAKGKERIEAIEEEEEEIHIVEEPDVPEEPVVVKPRRGRPPKAKTAAAKAKKVATEQETAPVDTLLEVAAPTSNPAHSRTRSVTDVDAEAASSTSKPKSLMKDGVKLIPAVEVPLRQSSTNKGHRGTTAPFDNEGGEPHAVPVKSKPNGASKAQSKAKSAPPGPGEEDEKAITPPPRGHSLMPPPPVPNEPVRTKNRKSSSTSDDAGYATAEYAMDIDPPQVAQPQQSRHQRNSSQPSSTKAISPPPTATRQSPAEPPEASRGTSRPPSRASSKPAGRPSARPGSARPPSRLNSEAVAISSDEEDAPVKPAPKAIKRIVSKQKLAEERARSRTPVANGSQDVEMDVQTGNAPLAASHHPKSKVAPARTQATLQIEIVKPPPPPPVEEDVEMVEETPSPSLEVAPELDAMVPPELDATVPPPLINGAVSRKTSSATPPPRTPSLPPVEPGPADKPARVLPSFDDDMESGAPEDVAESLFLSNFPLQKLTTLTEDECNLTIEQFIKREIERQYLEIKEEGEKRIASFLEKAAEARRQIEAA